MTLLAGNKLNHYEIFSQLGKGDMGEVYQAKAQKLGRDVAIKVLPEEFAKDADRVARFQREAKLLESLNHPKIAAIRPRRIRGCPLPGDGTCGGRNARGLYCRERRRLRS